MYAYNMNERKRIDELNEAILKFERTRDEVK